ncbi:MAG: hypothetical protein MUO68_13955 [Desulfobacteraceae bacterium]|nr:hypothetical protein [Desulfobacteraceae bacterium]
MPDFVFLAKLISSVSIVVLLSWVAEHMGPKVAGLLSGYPLGAAIALFFYGLEVSPQFASKSAVYTMIGLVASQAFVYCFDRISGLRRLSGNIYIVYDSDSLFTHLLLHDRETKRFTESKTD